MKYQKRIKEVLIHGILMLVSQTVWADLSLLRNTRESASAVIRNTELKNAKNWLSVYSASNPRALDQLEASFKSWAQGLEPGRELCESSLLEDLDRQLKKDGFTQNSKRSVIHALTIFRQNDWIDDLVLAPLLITARAIHASDNHTAEVLSEDVAQDNSDDNANELQRRKIFKDLSACPNDAYRTVVSQIRALKNGKLSRLKLRRWIRRANREDLISNKTRSQLIALANAKYDRVPRKISSALDEMNSAKFANRLGEEGVSDYAAERSKGHRYLSRRMELYARFSGLQIVLLSETFKKFKERISAKSADVVIHYESQADEVYHLSPLEQYRMAVKMLHKEIVEMKLSTLFEQKKVSFEDLIMAGLETGEISAKDIEAVLKVDDLWNPQVPGWKKVYNYTKLIGFPLLVFIPPPYNVIASMIVVLSEALLMPKDPVAADDAGVSIF